MRRWPEILLTLILFAAGMAVLSWAVNATMPSAFDWAADRIGDGAALIIVGAVIVALAIYGWRGHRPRKGSAGRLEGR